MMERLTYRGSETMTEEDGWIRPSPEEGTVYSCYSTRKIIERLAEYEDLEEQGLLLRLPCKVGDTVWVITSPFNVFEGIEYNENLRDECYESFISSVTFYKNSVQYRINAKVTNHFISAYYCEQDFGKTVFLTKEEAEQKLKEMESESE